MRRSYKFRLYPTANQERELGVMLESHRRLYNQCLEMRNIAYGGYKLGLTSYDQNAWFKSERRTNPWFAKLNFSSAQGTMRRLDKSFANFYRRVKARQEPGYPRFKGRDFFNSIEFTTYGDGIRLKGKLRVQHIGLIRCRQHRETKGKVKTARIKREGEKWYVILSCDLGDIAVAPSTNPAVGTDLGLEAFLTTSVGERIENPRLHKHELPALRCAQRAVSRKMRGGKNRHKAGRAVAKIHARVANCRRDFHHKTALGLVQCYGLVAVERLIIANMIKNRRLARSIADAGWGQFISILKYKAENAGVRVVEVDPKYTSQDCPQCGRRKAKSLSERWHSCECGLSIHRDTASAQEVLRRALVVQAGTRPVGANAGGSQHCVAQEAVRLLANGAITRRHPAWPTKFNHPA